MRQTLGLHITPPPTVIKQWPLKTGLVIPVGRSRNCENCDPQEVKHLQISDSQQLLAEVQNCIFLTSQSKHLSQPREVKWSMRD